MLHMYYDPMTSDLKRANMLTDLDDAEFFIKNDEYDEAAEILEEMASSIRRWQKAQEEE